MSENKRYILVNGLKFDIYFDNKEKRKVESNEILNILNAYNDMLEQAEAIKAKMNESWLLKKFIKK